MSEPKRFDTAYDAFWFLHNHPEFNLPERSPLSAGDTIQVGNVAVTDAHGFRWQHWPITRSAIDTNLDVFYARVDDTGTVNNDRSKNTHVECWLEFGQLAYDTFTDDQNEPSVLNHYHDVDLDCGAPTFDEALVMLANLVLAKYGDLPQSAQDPD